MKRIKKTALVLALLLCLGFGMPLIPAGFAFADNEGFTEGNSIVIEDFATEGVVGEPYTISTGTSSDGAVSVAVKNPYGVDVQVNTNTFTPTISGAYSVVYTVNDYSKTMYVNVTDSSDGIEIVYPANSDRIIPTEIGRPAEGETITIKVPNVTVNDADGNPIENNPTISVDVNGVELVRGEDGNFTYNVTNTTAYGEHTFTFKYMVDGSVVASLKRTMQVSSSFDNDYEFTYSYDSTPPTSAVLGVERTLPSVTGKDNDSGAEVSVYYTVKAEYQSGTSTTDVTNDVISVNEDGAYVFTANKEGNYTFTYSVQDYKGQAARVSSSSFQIRNVEDSQDPEPVVVEPYTTIDDETYVEAEHKLANNVNISDSPILIYPIYATDNANGYTENNLELYRTVRNSSNTDVFDERDIEEDITGKILVFNSDIVLSDYSDEQEVIEGYTKSQLYIVDTEITADTYTIFYNAKDKAGNENSISYTLRALTDFRYNDEDKPEITFTENLPSAVFFGEKISFATPTAKDVNTVSSSYVDTRMKVEVSYTLYAGDSELESKKADEEDSLLVWNEDTSKYEITIPSTYETATRLVITATAENDSKIQGSATKEVVITNSGDTMATTINSVTTAGLNDSYIQGAEIVLPTVVYYEDIPEYMSLTIQITHENGSTFTAYDVQKEVADVASQSYKSVTYYDAKFIATRAGTYEISYTTKDAGNNVTIKAFTLVVSEDPNSTEIRMTGLPTAINEGSLELGETADLAIPTLTTSLEYSYEVQIVSGPTGADINNYRFTPKAVGTYSLQYVATVVGRDEPIKSKIYTVEVVDTTAPTLSQVYYPNSAEYGTDFFIKLPGMSDISGIDLENSQVTISSSRSTSTFRYSKLLANGVKKPDTSYTNLEADGTIKYSLPYNNLLYTIEYTVADIYGNEASASYEVKVGDTESPTLSIPDDILKESYKFSEFSNGKTLTIDISGITADDNLSLTDNESTTVEDYIRNNIEITVTRGSTEIKSTTEGRYIYNINEVGTYTVTFSLSDPAGNVREVSRTFTVTEDSTTPMTQEEIIGTVLIVVSVLVLAGVVIYFIVSKKKSNVKK